MRVKELAELIGVSEDTVRNSVKRCGIEVQNGKATELSDVEVAKVVMELKLNKTVRDQLPEAPNETLTSATFEPASKVMKSQIREIVSSELSDVVKQVVNMTTDEVARAVATEVTRVADRDYVRDLQKYTEALLKGYKKEIKGLEEKVERLERELTETREKAYEVISGISF